MKNQAKVRLIIFLCTACIVCAIGLLLRKNIPDDRADAQDGIVEATAESEPYDYHYSFIPCTKLSDREDVLRTYKIDYYAPAEDGSGTQEFLRTETVSKRICDH